MDKECKKYEPIIREKMRIKEQKMNQEYQISKHYLKELFFSPDEKICVAYIQEDINRKTLLGVEPYRTRLVLLDADSLAVIARTVIKKEE